MAVMSYESEALDNFYFCYVSTQALTGDCGFLAANLYARSIFGEDALANLSIEKALGDESSPVQGHIRIRAKTQVFIIIIVCLIVVTVNTGNGIESWRQD